MSLPRSLDDLILDGLIAKIKAHRDADALLYPALTYDVARNQTRPWEASIAAGRPLVSCSLDSDTPAGKDYTARYKALCLVPTFDEDEIADKRLSVLKEQVRLALMDRADYDLGQTPGTLGKVSRPTWTPVSFDDSEQETSVLVGEWSIEVTYIYEPAEITGPALSEISIELGQFSALYHIGGTP